MSHNDTLQPPSSGTGPYSGSLGSAANSEASLNRVKNLPGYKTPVFSGKEEQRLKVEANVAAKGFMPKELVRMEVNWFYQNLGIDDTYFRNETVDVISDHILALFGAKILAYTKHDANQLVIDLEKVTVPGEEKEGGSNTTATSTLFSTPTSQQKQK